MFFRNLCSCTALTLSLVGFSSPSCAWETLEDLTVPQSRVLLNRESDNFNRAMQAMIAGDTTQASELLTPLAEGGVTSAQAALASLLSRIPQAKQQKEALKWTYFAARGGDWHAQAALAQAYREGKLIAKDLYQALTWLDRAAAEGGSEVKGQLVQLGNEVLQAAKQDIDRGNYTRAERMLLPVAHSGSVEAQETLAKLYAENRLGANQNDKARFWYEKAAEQGSKSADYALALSYLEESDLTEERKHQVVELLLKAADPGKAEAQYQLGIMYLTGWGVQKDEQTGIFWYRLAAEQGNATAQYALGVHYVLGKSVKQDKYEAHRWFREAAEQGFAKAQHNLALTYLHGIGIDKQPDKAQIWFQKAALNGIEKSNAFIEHTEGLTDIVQTAIPSKSTTAKAHDKPAVKPIKTAKVSKPIAKGSRPVSGWKWFSNLPDNGYTLQVLSSHRADSVDDFLNTMGLSGGKYLHYITRFHNRSWHVVQYGYFKDQKAADAAANKISKGYTLFKPWVREVKSIKRHFNNT